MIKQPALGQKISELRKAKGWTQEELVEKCNVSVRTIQRIETGEVTPRSYTIKIILAALDHDLTKIFDDAEEIANQNSRNKPSYNASKHLNAAWIFGILYFILSFVEAPVEYFRFQEDEMVLGRTPYIVLKIVVLLSLVFFQRGFVILGELFNNYLLKIISIILIGAHVLMISYDVASLFYDSLERKGVLYGSALLYGVIGIIYGVSLARLNKSFGRIARLAAAVEIIAGCLFVTIVLSLIGGIVHIPAELFEIIILFKAIEIIKTKETSTKLTE